MCVYLVIILFLCYFSFFVLLFSIYVANILAFCMCVWFSLSGLIRIHMDIYIYIYRVCIDIWIVLIFSWSEVKVSVKCVMTVGYITCFFLLILHNIVVLCQFGISI